MDLLIKTFLAFIALCFVTQVAKGNLYFPELYEDSLYKPKNLGPNPMSYQTVSRWNSTIVEWVLRDDVIEGNAKFSEESGPTNCALVRSNIKNVTGDSCVSVQSALLAQPYVYLVTLQCKNKNRAVLFRLSKWCITKETANSDLELVYTAFDNLRELHLHFIGNKTSSVLVWLKKTQLYSIINVRDWPENKIQLESNLVIGDLQNELKIADVSAAYDFLYVFSDSCLYSCPLRACREMELIVDSCVINPNNESVAGLTNTAEDGERMLLLDKYITLNSDTHSFKTFFSVYCAGRLTHHFYKCGGFVIQDVVMTFNMLTGSLKEHFPCSVSYEGSLIACLILGEPRIFDISDRKSAYPISTFTVSAWRLGVAINRFGFASGDTFFFEIVPSATADPKGFIFNVRAELQPALIASRLLYPSLATSITPAESFLLVNHQTRDIWLFSHGGRLFFRDGSKENALSIDFEYAEAYSFFIADTLSTVGVSHNFEHPFAFFSPDGKTFAYLSYYRSPYGAFSASAITITNTSSPDLRSIVSVSDKVFVIQAGINPKNDLLLVVQELSNDYFTIQIFRISDMARISYNMSGIVAQAEVKGSWTWDDFDATESTRIWVIYFTNSENFLLASHNTTSLSTRILEYKITAQTYKIELQREGKISNCLAVTNYNDYVRAQLVVLCAETPLVNVVNQTYHITFISAITLLPICTQSIDHKFGSLLSKYDDLFVTNIPILDFNEIAQRLVISFEKTVLMYATDTCPFRLLYRFDHTDLIAGIGMIHSGQDTKPFGITFVTYLQKVDLIGDCINGYGVDTVLPRNYFCSRCTPGHAGLGCRLCPAGFYCSDYSQLQPSGACPEGFYCQEGTSTSNPLADILDKTATPPHLCPAGSYCPAGTAQSLSSDESANAPQTCLSGYYCPKGSVKPTQERCPENATSKVAGKTIEDCYCKITYYGSANKRCVPCLPNAMCIGGSTNQTDAMLYVSKGYWPDTPGNLRAVIKCATTISRFTPCIGSVCNLHCQNRTASDVDPECTSSCSNPCAVGHTSRLCSACQNGYYRKGPYHCAPCAMGLRQTVCVIAALLTSICILAVYFIRKHNSAKLVSEYAVTDQNLLEVLITVLLVFLGISSTASVLFMVFIVVIVYMQQLRAPPHATLTFIFYIQTLQALMQGNFVWPNFMRYLLQFLEVMYAPVPGLACLPNIYTGTNLGWEGAFVLIFCLPLVLGILVALYMFVTGTVQKRPVWRRAFLSYCLFMSVLQFPLSNMSLSTLSCKMDPVTGIWYMSSQPWKQCELQSVIQMLGVFGSVFFFMGIPFSFNYVYFKRLLPDDVHKEIGIMFLPDGVFNVNAFFVVFLTLRWMLLSIILAFIPHTWGLQRPFIIALLVINIILVLFLDPYEQYFPRKPDRMSPIEQKWHQRLCVTMSGSFLNLLTLFSVILSYTALDKRDNLLVLQIKSLVIAVVNLLICLYFIIFVLLEDRFTLFPKLSQILARLEIGFNRICCRNNYIVVEEDEHDKLMREVVNLDVKTDFE